MSNVTAEPTDDLKNKAKEYERKINELKEINNSLLQQKNIFYGMVTVSVFSLVIASILDVNNPKAAVIIIVMLCWTCLTIMVNLLTKKKEED